MRTETKSTDIRLRAERALLHPVWLVALAVLIVNDHVLKSSSMSGWTTGKLSDVAGLIVAPILFAALLRVTTRREFWASTAAVFGVFGAINVSAAAAAAWDSTMSLVHPWVTTVDPTDLFAMPVALAALWLIVPTMERARDRGRGVRLAQAGLATVAGIASVATSQPPPECELDDCIVQEATISSRVSLLNRSNELHVFRVSALRPDISVDCGEIERDPTRVLGRGAFTNATLWFVQSGQEIGITDGQVDEWGGTTTDETSRTCHAALIESETTPDIIVVWNDEFNTRTFSFDANIPKDLPIAEGTLVLDADYSQTPEDEIKDYRMRSACGSRAENCAEETLAPLAEIPTGARYTWNSRGPEDQSFHRIWPPEQFDRIFDPTPFCETPGPGEGLEWTTAPTGQVEVIGFEEGDDGCHRLTWNNPAIEGPSEWWICAPYDALRWLEPSEDETVDLSVTTLAEGGTAFNGIEMQVIRRDIETENFVDYRTIYATRGFGLPQEAAFDYAVDAREGCDAEILECGTATLPADVEVIGYQTTLRPGESTTIGTVVEREIHLVRATLNPVYDAACDETMVNVAPPQNQTPAYIETVVIRPQ